MKKSELIEKIEAYATARFTGNPILISVSLEILKKELDLLPEELTTIKKDEPN